MNADLLTVLENIEREKGISRKVLIESIEAALVSAAKKVLHDKDKDVEVKIDVASGKINIFSDGKEIVSQEFGRIAFLLKLGPGHDLLLGAFGRSDGEMARSRLSSARWISLVNDRRSSSRPTSVSMTSRNSMGRSVPR